MIEAIYFAHTLTPSEELAAGNASLVKHIAGKWKLDIHEPSEDSLHEGQLSDETQAQLEVSKAVIVEVAEADELTRQVVVRALAAGKQVLALHNRFAADTSKPAVDLSDLEMSRRQDCHRVMTGLIMSNVFLQVQVYNKRLNQY